MGDKFDYEQFLLHQTRRKFLCEPQEQVFLIGGQRLLYPEMLQLAYDLLSKVCLRDRKVLLMKFFDDLTETEIAEKVGVATTRINQITHRGLRNARWAGLQ